MQIILETHNLIWYTFPNLEFFILITFSLHHKHTIFFNILPLQQNHSHES